ncbi:MAG: hypothetical protein N3A69_15685 [Leptospiraceae bacterium]|nr:hypothetical protein [Leptospiraceae bacterium]
MLIFVPVLFRDSPIGIFIVEFLNKEELDQFKKKISIYYFILKTFSYSFHNQHLYNRYKTKFQNLHSF